MRERPLQFGAGRVLAWRRSGRASRRRARPAWRLAAAAVLVAAGLAAPSAASAQDRLFGDVSAGVHEPAISALAERGLFEGTLCGDGLFCPDDGIDRATVAVWLVRALEDVEPPPVEAPRFADVDGAAWEARYIERLAELGVTYGCRVDPLRYCPDRLVSRGQMASFLVRAFDLPPAGEAGFADTVGSTHRANIDALAAARVTVGCKVDPPLRYCPDRPVTRAEMATFLARALGLVASPAPMLPEVAAGDVHTCATRADATVVCWGDNTFGQADPPEGTFKTVEAGAIHTCAIRHGGAVACWGDNYLGQADPPGGAFRAVSAGWGHSCAVDVDGTISCWGDDIYGRTNPPAGTYTAVTAGAAHSCAITAEEAVVCWGWNHYGQTEAPAGVFQAVAAGAFHTCALAADGAIACWGWNQHGQTDAPAGMFRAVTVGWDHGCAIGADGAVACWGVDDKGQASPPAGAYRAVSAGWEHTCGIRVDGAVACWGADDTGQSNPPAGAGP